MNFPEANSGSFAPLCAYFIETGKKPDLSGKTDCDAAIRMESLTAA